MQRFGCDDVDESLIACNMGMQVVLLSACVANGQLYVLEVRSDETQWKLGSKAIKALRKSFVVA